MNLRWLFGNFTDPQYGMSLRDQMRLSNRAHERFTSNRTVILWTLFVILPPAMTAFVLLEPPLKQLGYGGNSGAYGVATVVLVLLFWPWCAWMYRFIYIKPIRRAMREAGYDLCIQCGYELTGLDEQIDRCPECGSTREPPKAPASDEDEATTSGGAP